MNSTTAMGKMYAPGRSVRLEFDRGLMAVRFQEPDVARVRLETHVKEIAQDGDRPDGDVEQDIGHHAHRNRPGNFVLAEGDQHQPGLNEAGHDVTADWQQAEQGVEPDADLRAWDRQCTIHEPGDPFQVAGDGLVLQRA